MSISGKITEILADEKIIKSDEIELYEYSINAVLEMGSNILATLFLGIILHKFDMTLLFLLIVIPLRSVIGGWHAKSSGVCFLFSILYYLAAIFLPSFLSLSREIIFLIFIILIALIPLFLCTEKRFNIEIDIILLLALVSLFAEKIHSCAKNDHL